MVMCRHTLLGLVGPRSGGYGQARSGELHPPGTRMANKWASFIMRGLCGLSGLDSRQEARLAPPGAERPCGLGEAVQGAGQPGRVSTEGSGDVLCVTGAQGLCGGMEEVQEALGGLGGQRGLARTGSWTQVASEEVVRGTWERGRDPNHLFPRPLVVGATCPQGLSSAPLSLSPAPRPGSASRPRTPQEYKCPSILSAPCGPSPCRRASPWSPWSHTTRGGWTHFTDGVSEAR